MGFWNAIFGRHQEVYLRALGFYFEPLGIDFGSLEAVQVLVLNLNLGTLMLQIW